MLLLHTIEEWQTTFNTPESHWQLTHIYDELSFTFIIFSAQESFRIWCLEPFQNIEVTGLAQSTNIGPKNTNRKTVHTETFGRRRELQAMLEFPDQDSGTCVGGYRGFCAYRFCNVLYDIAKLQVDSKKSVIDVEHRDT